MPTPALPDVHARAAAVLTAAGLTVLDADTDTDTGADADADGTGVRVRPAPYDPGHSFVVPVVHGRENFPPPLAEYDDRRSAWIELMQAARNALTDAGWQRLLRTDNGAEFRPPAS
ncbi:hypothetical protein [Streptomyces botrytidirepellens]|uniref:Uncharacterized protein n=1 Tax=Streptomyces botrytidirepellens TaxID=2486417 RepID=A0A3M8V9I5_9ACTN|nr:hypothetical protein [Streptomyces botrytidirepellens]RNG14302.1 hypothetical protein EEJ42_31515 [Streptomyces botrytidirepellens]